jgi:endonuclease G
MTDLNRMREARLFIQTGAVARWQARAAQRAETRRVVAEQGPGAADSPERQALYKARVRNVSFLRTAAAAARLPLGLERRMGPTLDFVGLAPSEQARAVGRPVARIVESVARGLVPQGFATGFLIAPDLLMTNWHVFPERADAVGRGANFLYEQGERGVAQGLVFELEPQRFYVSDPALDFAVVAVAPQAQTGEALADLGQITLIEARPKILKGHPVNIIQHPEGGPKQYAVAQNRLVDILEAEGFLQYETDTLEGSSGSPAFSEMWELVALHHASIPHMRGDDVIARDGSIWNEAMGDEEVHWVANEGTRISAIVAHLTALKLASPSEQQILRRLVASSADPVAEGVALVAAAPRLAQERIPGVIQTPTTTTIAVSPDMPSIQMTFTGPVTIHMGGSAEPQTVVAGDPSLRTVAPEKSIRFDPDYDNRKGYDPAFLDPDGTIRIPTPEVIAERVGELVKDDDGAPLVLKYHHFELVMNRVRKLQMWSAANIDYAPSRKMEGDRKSWGRDKWIPDPRLKGLDQIFDADFYKPAGNIDCGHIVRREDNEWGDSPLEIEFANSDTFHWTNCTPQHEAFNQATPGMHDPTYRGMVGIWGALENHIQRSRKDGDTRACLLAGPILTAEDPQADFGRGAIAYPLRFFKVVCVAEGAAGAKVLKVYAFILNQKDVVDRFGIERFDPGKFLRHQVSLKVVETEAGLKFDASLHAADTFVAS